MCLQGMLGVALQWPDSYFGFFGFVLNGFEKSRFVLTLLFPSEKSALMVNRHFRICK